MGTWESLNPKVKINEIYTVHIYIYLYIYGTCTAGEGLEAQELAFRIF
jgi:hypothetical protein